jgi:hypothetical protein
MQTRFDDLPRNSCLALLVLFLLTFATSITLSPDRFQVTAPPASAAETAEKISDTKLYKFIANSVRRGENYYVAAVREHRQHNFPLKPSVTVRLPTLAWMTATLGPTLTQMAMFGLIALVTLSWMVALRSIAAPVLRSVVFCVIVLSSMALTSATPLIFHETWAGMLIAASIALRRPDQYVASIITGLAAVLFRELALPYLIMMALFAAHARSWRETMGWCSAIAIAGVCFYLHAATVTAMLQPGDLASQGWNGLGGWAFFVSAVQETNPIGLLPTWFAQLMVPLSLFGWMAWRSHYGLCVSGFLLGYAVALMVFARIENTYWALLISPLLLAGLGFVPAGLLGLLKRCGSPAAALRLATLSNQPHPQ